MKNQLAKKDQDETWVVLVLIFGLAGIVGPVLALLLFLVLYFWL